MVRIHPGRQYIRGVAQLVARGIWDAEAVGSSPATPTEQKTAEKLLREARRVMQA